MEREKLTFISTRRGSKLLAMEQGGFRKILRYRSPTGKRKLESTFFIINNKPRYFVEKNDFLEFLQKEIQKVKKRLAVLLNSEIEIKNEIEEEIRNGN